LCHGPLPICKPRKFNPQFVRKSLFPFPHFVLKVGLELYLKRVGSTVVLVSRGLVNQRTGGDAAAFMDDLAGRVINIDMLTTDGFVGYPDAVRAAFGNEVNYGQLIKHYAAAPVGPETRYSPATCTGCTKQSVIGFPDPMSMSTSMVERLNLTVRMHNRRMTRLTNGHSKKLENHGHSMALFFMYYNYCRKHETLKGKTPAQAAGLTDHRWTLDELCGLAD
jgi:hypothetical protein